MCWLTVPGIGLPWSVINIYCCSIGEHWFPFLQQVSVANSVLDKGGTLCPISVLNDEIFIWFEFVWFLCVLSIFVSSHMYPSCYVWKTLSLASPLALRIFLFLFLHRPLSLEELNKNILFRNEFSNVSHSLYIVQLLVYVLITIYCRKKFLWWKLSDVLTYMSKTNLDEIHMFQGRSVRIRIIKKKEQWYERNKTQKHSTALGEKFREYWIRL